MSKIDLNTQVGQLVAERPSRARAFQQLGIDYCCRGKRTLAQACNEHELEPERVLEALRAAEAEEPSQTAVQCSRMTLAELADHIESTHHKYLQQHLPELQELAAKVVDVHADRHPELRELVSVLTSLHGELNQHMAKEEQVLFPAVREMDRTDQPISFPFGSVANPIGVMEQEHDQAGEALARLRQLTDGFAPPADACDSYRALLRGLQELETDLFQHIHKENNILFPEALARENEMSA